MDQTAPLHPIEPQSHPHEVRTFLEWRAPGRPFRKRGKEFYINSLFILVLIEVILFLFSQYVLMMVALSLTFVSFALVTVPPSHFRYKVTSEGIMVEDHFYLWQELYDFYFKKRDGVNVLHVRTRALIPGELTLTLDTVSDEDVKKALLPYLPFREFIRPTFMEKSATWLSRNFPLEKPHEKVAS